MYRIALVNMPLANLAMPSLALTQLQAVARKALGGRAQAELHYLNQDFALHVGLLFHDELMSFAHHPSGLGDWFFRAAAFPGAPDNADDYFQRYYPPHAPQNQKLREWVMEKRAGLVPYFESLIDRYRLDQADVVGFTSMFSQHVACLAMARLIKARNPGVVVLVGGANCEAPMGRELIDHAPMVDFVFSGPSLRSFPALVRCLMEGDEAGCHRIDGVFSRQNEAGAAGCGTNGVAAAGGRAAVRAFGEENDVNELVDFDYEPFLSLYEANFPGRARPVLLFETSRGCWWGERAHCTFCGLNGSTINYRSMRAENAFTLFNGLFQHAARVSELQSVDNILPKSYLTDVLPYLDTPEGMAMFYEVKADLSEDDFRVLKKSRVLRVQPGIEALNTSTLKLMRKGISVFQNVQFLVNAVRYGIEPAWNLLIGFPREEIEVYEKYLGELHLLTHFHPPQGVFPIRFDRFSPYYEEAAEYGLELQPLDWYALTYPWPGEALANLAYYFADQNYAAPYAMNAARMVSKLREKVERWKALWKGPRKPELRVTERNGQAYVFDSRAGVPVEYPIAGSTHRVLEALATAKKPANVARELEGVDVDAEIATLLQRGLVFHENERYISLVVPPVNPVSIPVERTDFVKAAA